MKIRQAATWDFNAAQAINKFIIGAFLRTKKGVKPLLISIGHIFVLPSSIEWVIQCCQGYCLLYPKRKAHLASRKKLNSYSGLE